MSALTPIIRPRLEATWVLGATVKRGFIGMLSTSPVTPRKWACHGRPPHRLAELPAGRRGPSDDAEPDLHYELVHAGGGSFDGTRASPERACNLPSRAARVAWPRVDGALSARQGSDGMMVP